MVRFCLLVLASAIPATAQVRHEVKIPDLPGFRTLVCDFHMHTVFSDGGVWPTVRIDEAWRTGLDAIALTDHIEYQPHADDLPTNHNRPFQLCEQRARQHGLLLIRAAEITRKSPGHFNALFLDDIDSLATPDFVGAVRQAGKQGGFVFWNHHDWKGPEEGEWREVHQQLFDEGLLHGMEVANSGNYYPRAHQWCLDKNLTMLGNSDIHPPDLRTSNSGADHRTCTLVFVAEPGVEGVRQALVGRRTAVWFADRVIGRRELLMPLFDACVHVDPPHLWSGNTAWFRVHNRSAIDLRLTRTAGPGPRQLEIPADRTALLRVRLPAGEAPVDFGYTVDNFLVAPETGLPVAYQLARPAPDTPEPGTPAPAPAGP